MCTCPIFHNYSNNIYWPHDINVVNKLWFVDALLKALLDSKVPCLSLNVVDEVILFLLSWQFILPIIPFLQILVLI